MTSMTSNNIQALIEDYTRWNELHQEYLAKIDPSHLSRYYTKENAENNAKLHATLQYLAEKGQLSVERHSGPEEWYHSTDICLPNGTKCANTVGFVTDMDVHLGKWDKQFVEYTKDVDENHIRIHLMIGTYHPELPEFRGKNLDHLDLGMNDDYFDGFDIVIAKRFVTDNF